MTSQGIESFLAFLRQSEQQYREAQEAELMENAVTQDILHALELQHQSYHQIARLAQELKIVRQQRRAAKDIRMQTEPLINWLAENRAVVKGLERLLGEVRKTEKRLENRIYIPRTKKDAEEARNCQLKRL